MSVKSISQQEFEDLIKKFRRRRFQLSKAEKRVREIEELADRTPVHEEELQKMKQRAADFKKWTKTNDNGKADFAAYLESKGYKPELDGINFNIDLIVRETSGAGKKTYQGYNVLKNLVLNGITFNSCDTTGVFFDGSDIDDVTFINCTKMDRTSFVQCQIGKMSFESCECSEVNLLESNVGTLEITDSTLEDCRFDGVKCHTLKTEGNSKFKGCQFTSSTPTEIELSDATTFEDTLGTEFNKIAEVQAKSKPKDPEKLRIGVVWKASSPGHAAAKVLNYVKQSDNTPCLIDYVPDRDIDRELLKDQVQEILQERNAKLDNIDQLQSEIDSLPAEIKKMEIEKKLLGASYPKDKNDELTRKKSELSEKEESIAKIQKEMQQPIPQYLLAKVEEDPSSYSEIAKVMKYTNGLLSEVDSVMIPGGLDVEPEFSIDRFTEDMRHETTHVEPDYVRSLIEFTILKRQQQKRMPVLGICRGAQIANVYYGGTSHQHIGDEHVGRVVSIPRKAGSSGIVSGAFRDGLTTPAFHHQAIDRLANEFELAADDDGVVKAAESRHDSNIMITQIHPEFKAEDSDYAGDLSQANYDILNGFVGVSKTSKRLRSSINEEIIAAAGKPKTKDRVELSIDEKIQKIELEAQKIVDKLIADGASSAQVRDNQSLVDYLKKVLNDFKEGALEELERLMDNVVENSIVIDGKPMIIQNSGLAAISIIRKNCSLSKQKEMTQETIDRKARERDAYYIEKIGNIKEELTKYIQDNESTFRKFIRAFKPISSIKASQQETAIAKIALREINLALKGNDIHQAFFAIQRAKALFIQDNVSDKRSSVYQLLCKLEDSIVDDVTYAKRNNQYSKAIADFESSGARKHLEIITQKQYETLMRDATRDFKEYNALKEKISANNHDPADLDRLMILHDKLCLEENGGINFSKLLIKNNYAPVLDDIQLGVHGVTYMHSVGAGTFAYHGTSIFKNATFENVRFDRCEFKGLNLDGALFTNTHFKDCLIDNTNLKNCRITNTEMNNCKIQSSSMDQAKIEGTRLIGTKFNKSSIAYADLSGASIIGCEFRRTSILNSSNFHEVTDSMMQDCALSEKQKQEYSSEEYGTLLSVSDTRDGDKPKPKIGIVWKSDSVGHTADKVRKFLESSGATAVTIDYNPPASVCDRVKLHTEVRALLKQRKAFKNMVSKIRSLKEQYETEKASCSNDAKIKSLEEKIKNLERMDRKYSR